MTNKIITLQYDNSKKRLKLIVLVVLLISFIIILTSNTVFSELEALLKEASTLITIYPRIGMLVFVLLAALSAMFAFFSSAILVPIGVYTWGFEACFFLLWFGWCLGGLLAYVLGYFAGRELIAFFVSEEQIKKLETQLNTKARFMHILGLQALLPSEVPGYVLGALRYRLDYYFYALAIVEIPYALATISLGESFLQRDLTKILSTLAVLILFMAGVYKFHQKKTMNEF